MKIELRDIHYRENLSLNPDPFDAQLYVNGQRACTVSDDGFGKYFRYSQFSPGGELLKKRAEVYCEQAIDVSLEYHLADLLRVYLQKELAQKIENITKDNVVYGRLDGAISILSGGKSIAEILKSPEEKRFLEYNISRNVLPYLKKGDIIFNTNIPEQLLKKAGLSPDQYQADKLKSGAREQPRMAKKPGRKL